MMNEKTVPQKEELRKFGYTIAAILSILFGLILPYLFDSQAGEYSWEFYGLSGPIWPFAVALFFFLSALICPVVLGPIYTAWMKVGHVLGAINTRIILGLIFYIMVFPIGLLLKLFGKDPLLRKHDLSVQSYRIISEQPDQNHIERPY
jgi:Saxitoxin biosynthesis operon protein SxtJ